MGRGRNGGGRVARGSTDIVDTALPNGIQRRDMGDFTGYSFNVDGNRGWLRVFRPNRAEGRSATEVDFTVNGSRVADASVSPIVGATLLRRAMQAWQNHLASEPDGGRYVVMANTGDRRVKRGQRVLGYVERVKFLQGMGFSAPLGENRFQYAVKKNGRLVPSAQFANYG